MLRFVKSGEENLYYMNATVISKAKVLNAMTNIDFGLKEERRNRTVITTILVTITLGMTKINKCKQSVSTRNSRATNWKYTERDMNVSITVVNGLLWEMSTSSQGIIKSCKLVRR